MTTPILLITFNRPKHTRRTLKALLSQIDCEDSLFVGQDIFVFQDGARENNEEDVVKCSEVRKVIEDCSVGSSAVFHKCYSDHNRGCRDAIIYAISSVLKQFEQVIVVEDDIITSPAFLEYMNAALEYYKDKKTVFSISGHSHSPSRFQVPDDYEYDVFASPRLFNWGWGTWRDRWLQTDWSFSYYERFMSHYYERLAFCRGGNDLLPMLIDEKEGRSSAWDIQFAFAHFANHAVSIVPCVSYTYNIGLDGSGTHCGNSKGEEMPMLNLNTSPRFLDVLYFDSRIINSLYSIFLPQKRPLWQKAINYLARRTGRKAPFTIKGKVFLN